VPGDARHYGRFSSAANLGMFVGPALEGATWSMLGPWAGFALISLWGVALPVAVLSIPRRGFIPLNDKDRQSLTPDLRSYVAAGKLLRIPGIMLVILTTFLRIACFSIRGSFYPVYLGQAGFSGSVIGLLVSLGSVIGGMAALLADFFVWLCGSQRNALLIGVALGIISVAITPLMPGVVLLATTACVFGVAMGVNQPILLSMLSSSVSCEYQGMSVGLRTTTNLVAGVSIPILMGFVSELGGISASFYVTGATLLAATALVAVATRPEAVSAGNATGCFRALLKGILNIELATARSRRHPCGETLGHAARKPSPGPSFRRTRRAGIPAAVEGFSLRRLHLVGLRGRTRARAFTIQY
jgi:MFS family permease